MQLQEIQQLKAKILDVFLNTSQLSEFVTEISKLMKNPVIVCDATFRILSASDIYPIQEKSWKKSVETGACTYEFIASIEQKTAIKEDIVGQNIPRVMCPMTQKEKIVLPVLKQQRVVAWLIILEEQQVIDDDLVSILKIIQELLGKILLEQSWQISNHSHKEEDLLYDMLINQLSIKEIKRRLEVSQLNLTGSFVVVIIDISHFDHTTAYGTAGLKELLVKEWKFWGSILYEGQVVGLCKAENYQKKLSEITRFAKKHQLKMGISNHFFEFESLKLVYNQAVKILKVGTVLYPKQVIFYQYQTTPFIWLPELPYSQAYGQFIHPVIATLDKYDQKQNSDLCKTFFVFLQEDRHIQRAADRLFIHRNTLSYQLQRIYDLTGIDVEDYQEFTDIYLAYRILDFYKKISYSGDKNRW